VAEGTEQATAERLSLRMALLFVAGLMGVGTAGYMLTEGWSAGHALYVAVVTLTTLGSEGPTTPAGKAFTIIYVLVGVATSLYLLSALSVSVLEGRLSQRVRRRRMERAIERLRDHYIICGYGRVGREIGGEFAREGIPFVLIDIDQARLAEAETQGQLVITGSPASDDVLRYARLETARGLIAALDDDAENIYVVLSARVLRPKLFIVARANHPETVAKLERAGADQVLSPYAVGGRLMAAMALRPVSVECVDAILHNARGNLVLDDVRVAAGSPLVDCTVGELRGRYQPEVSVLAGRTDGRIILNPGRPSACPPATPSPSSPRQRRPRAWARKAATAEGRARGITRHVTAV